MVDLNAIYLVISNPPPDGEEHPVLEIPAQFNGSLGTVDMNTNQSFIDRGNRICVTEGANRLFDVSATAKYRLHICQGSIINEHAEAVDAAVTDEHHKKFLPDLAGIIGRGRIYAFLGHCGIAFRFNSSDVATRLAARAEADDYLARLYAALNVNTDFKIMVAQQQKFILMSFIANAIHREQTDGHNWITADASRTDSAASRALAVAGSGRNAFRDYMNVHGHDSNHHLDTETLNVICNAITGQTEVTVPVSEGNPIMYAGRDVTGMSVSDILHPGRAAADRWPPTKLGKSAVIVALGMTKAVVIDITSKVKVSGAAQILSAVDKLLARVKAVTSVNDEYLAFESSISSLISNVYGYAYEKDLLEETSKAFESHARRDKSAIAVGVSLAKCVKAAVPHDEAANGAIASALATMGTQLQLAATKRTGDGDGTFGGDVNIDTAVITAEVGKDKSNELMKLMMANKSPGES